MSVKSDPAASGGPFRDAMSRVAGAVHIVATDGPAGLGGATATAVTSVSDAPPSLLVCLNSASATLQRLRVNRAFSVNVLCAVQEDVARVFSGAAGLDGAARFLPEHDWIVGAGPPALKRALAIFRCTLADVTPVGSHVIVIGTVESAMPGEDAAPLLYHRRRYRAL